MIFENEQTTIFSVLIENNDQYYDVAELEENPYLYKILRSYDNGLTWSHLATMKASDLEEAHDTVDLLNAGAKKNNSFKDNNPINIFGNKLKKIEKNFPHSHTDTGWDSFTNYKKEIDSVIDQSIDPKDDGIR
jgi:galactose-1-phosphate uridylyltransferase